ncbi:conserved hypothetical protein [Candidatus Desulfarcum epimagneticum]|uniref:DUF3786 domain-containing protein n=1 Tax=uncultured Desulfobacteraceae bacterium TaxID=218296 RepID=A0A484HL46_9BACT|nr:conserved hypothetical protein [uncultured Desulfobacteraceae bacterium]
MSTGACGINCDVCRLRHAGVCSTCGPGNSPEAARKIEAQKRILGRPCPLLECARDRGVRHCFLDCDLFPCERFEDGGYPYSPGFLSMQKRRRNQSAPHPQDMDIQTPGEYWDELARMDMAGLCRRSLSMCQPPAGISLSFLNEDIVADMESRTVFRLSGGRKESCRNSLLELLTLVYLLGVKDGGVQNRPAGPRDLKDGHFFQGPHELDVSGLEKKYGRDPDAFEKAAKKLGGVPQDMADAAFRLRPFPKIPLYYLLWTQDGEFPARVSILFDRSIESHFEADAIWGTVSLVTRRLMEADG